MIRSYRATLSGDRRQLLERFRYVDAARKVVGVGSVGTRAWIMLLLGRDDADPLFLQFKEAEASVLEPFLGASEHEQHGQRVVEGQRLMQAAERHHARLGADQRRRRRRARLLRAPALGREGLGAGRDDEPDRARLLRRSLRPDAGSRPRSGRRQRRDRRLPRRAATPSTAPSAEFAEAYADQNERDYAAVVEAVESGRIAAETEV